MAIEEVKVRAKITIGSLVVETPYILNFSVSRTRANPSSMTASLKVPGTDVSLADGIVVVEAGVRGNLKTIFTGDLRSMKVSPVWEDPSYVALQIDATDVLARLSETRFTRRQLGENHMYAVINGTERKNLSGRFNTINEPTKFFGDPSVVGGGGTGFAGTGAINPDARTGQEGVKPQGKIEPLGVTLTGGDG